MDELHLLGVHEDGDHLLLATLDDQQRFRLPLNDALRAAVRWERSKRTGAAAADGDELRPRDVQAMIRAGATAEEAAERANWTVEKVRRYEGPILAERAYMAAEAGRAHVRSRLGAVQLAERVNERFEVRGVSAEAATWDSWRDEDGQWTVEVRFAAGGRQRTASWHFNKGAMTVSARDDEARWLSDDGADPEPTVQHVVPTRGRVYDVEAEGGLRPAGGAGGVTPHGTTQVSPNDEVSLMATMRERSTARRRRGQRKSPAASPTALPPLGDTPTVDAPPLAELRYDPETMPPPPAAHGEPETDGIDGRPEPAVVADEHLHERGLAGFDDDEPDQPERLDDESDRPRPALDDADGEASDDSQAEVAPPARSLPEAAAPLVVAEPAPEPVAALPPYAVASDTVDEPELPLEDEPGTPQDPAPEPVVSPEPEPEPEPDLQPEPAPAEAATSEPAEEPAATPATKPRSGQRTQPSKASRSRRKGRASVPAWDDIVFGAKPGQDD